MLIQRLSRQITKSLVIHPICLNVSKKSIELEDIYEAEEAIGLIKSIGWEVVKPPISKFRLLEDNIMTEEQFPVIDRNSTQIEFKKNDKVKLYGLPAICQGSGLFKVDLEEFDFEDEETEISVDDRHKFAISCVLKLKRKFPIAYFSLGVVRTLRNFLKKNRIKILFVNDFLSPNQLKNLKKSINREDSESQKDLLSRPIEERIVVIDRIGIILTIFNKRARSEATKLQIALLYLNYTKTLFVREEDTFTTIQDIYNFDITKPEEVRVQITSAKQTGRRGAVAGEGESQQEIQRRLHKDLEKHIKDRIEAAKIQQKNNFIKAKNSKDKATVALIGYTNAGKSALLNYFAKSEVSESKDMLFQTLNTITRKVYLRSGIEIMLVDTVGFISNLPHELFSAFLSTLEHLNHSDIVIHVRDISHPQTDRQKETVLSVIKKLGLEELLKTERFIEVNNKYDIYLEKNENQEKIMPNNTDSLFISAKTGYNIDILKEQIELKIHKLFGYVYHTFKHEFTEHDRRNNWLREYAGVKELFEVETDEQFITFKAYIIEKVLKAYEKAFEKETHQSRRNIKRI